MSNRTLNVFLLLVLSFLLGFWSHENKDFLSRIGADLYRSAGDFIEAQFNKGSQRAAGCACGVCLCRGCDGKCEETLVLFDAKENAVGLP